MNYSRKSWTALLIVIGCVSAGATASAYREKADGPQPQDVISLDRRISMMEQRLMSVESRIIRLEQQSTLAHRPSSSVDYDGKVSLLRAEIERFHSSLYEIECGVSKLDQRTLSDKGRERLGRSAAADPCRLNPDSPIQFSVRPSTFRNYP